MTKTKLILVISFLVTFVAGGAVGLVVRRSAQTPPRRPSLSRELDLTSEQREQMRKIWSEVMSNSGRQPYQSRREIRKERDEAIEALFTEEQKSQYQQIIEQYTAKSDELAEQRRERFKEAAQRTKQVLTKAQREKYEELLKKRGERSRRFRREGREAEKADAKDTPQREE